VPATNGDAEKKDVSKDAKGFARALLDFDRPKANPNSLLTRQVSHPDSVFVLLLTLMTPFLTTPHTTHINYRRAGEGTPAALSARSRRAAAVSCSR
jgi:hypothetical protein